MKAERRHELRKNSLSAILSDLPLYLRFHANKFLAALIVICVIFLLIRYRMNAAQESRQMARTSIVSAQGGIEQLRFVDQTQNSDIARAQERKKLSDQIKTAVDQVLANTSDPTDAQLRADAMVARGDLHWALANLPPLPGAATQPGIASMPTTTESLDNAEAAYQQVLKSYDAQKIAKGAALFGLAAVEENRGNWEKAIADYNSVLSDPALAGLFRDIARQRIAVIPQIQKPVYLGSFSSTQPATGPSTEPATAPTGEVPMPKPQ